MNPKAYLKEQLIAFQVRIAELSGELKAQQNRYAEREQALLLDVLEVLDAFENIEAVITAKQAGFDKTTRMLSKNIRSIHKKLRRMLKNRDVVKIEFPDNKAHMDRCRIVDTHPRPDLADETILQVAKSGYMNRQDQTVLRKAEVVTVQNG